MISIYIGVCKTREDERFEKSFRDFTDSIVGKYSVCKMVVNNIFLPDAQNKIARDFLETRCDYLLFLDDDQWGHTKEMLDTLVRANTYVATMKTYSRHYPYMCAAWNRVGHNAMVPVENGQGYKEVDLCGFPMTLIRRDLFDKLKYPYFRAIDAEGRNWNTDIAFCEDISELDIKPVVCFQHCLNHDKITQENVFQYRNDERFHNNNIAWFNILNQLQGA